MPENDHQLSPRRPLRADARRNIERILNAAGAAFARDGAAASLEEVARQAGVGSATLHRHFPSRQALLSAVFHDRVESLCVQARTLIAEAEPGTALITWLRALGTYVSTTHGLAATLLPDPYGGELPQDTSCAALIDEAGGALLRRAQAAGAARPEVSIGDLLTLMNAIALATERSPNSPAEAERLLALVIGGLLVGRSAPLE